MSSPEAMTIPGSEAPQQSAPSPRQRTCKNADGNVRPGVSAARHVPESTGAVASPKVNTVALTSHIKGSRGTPHVRIAFLLHNAYAMGGTVRTTMTLADTLAGRHQVELVSVFRHREKPQLGRSPEVPLRALVDRREGSADSADPLARRAGEVFPKGDSHAHEQPSGRAPTRHLQPADAPAG